MSSFKEKIAKELIVVVAITGALWAAVYWLDFGPEDDDTILSPENESKLGEIFVNQVFAQYNEANTPELDAAVAAISHRLLLQLPETQYRYRILVVKSEMVNALTLPGGNIVVFTGLIEMAESAEELAGVLAHEMGHVEQHHVIKKLMKTLGLEILTGALAGGDDILLGELFQMGASIVFDRHQEREADDFAMELLVKAKVNPRVLATFFRKVYDKSSQLEKNLEIISTHPETQARIRAALQYQLPPDASFTPIEIDWPAVKASLSALEESGSPSPEVAPKDGGPA